MNKNACELGNSNNTSKGSIDVPTDTLSSASLSDPIQRFVCFKEEWYRILSVWLFLPY